MDLPALTPVEQARYDLDAPCWSRDTTLARLTAQKIIPPPSK